VLGNDGARDRQPGIFVVVEDEQRFDVTRVAGVERCAEVVLGAE
jgi:hypothetical protein